MANGFPWLSPVEASSYKGDRHAWCAMANGFPWLSPVETGSYKGDRHA
jgi:hypothetical protein